MTKILDIRELDEFKNFYKWQLTAQIIHRKTEEVERNLNVFTLYLGNIQHIDKYSLEKIGIKYKISKERVRQIFNKYLIHFILYLYYVLGYETKNILIKKCLGLLSR